MENKRIIITVGIIGIVFAIFNLWPTFAYDEKITHPLITQAIINFYNKSFPDKQINSAYALPIIQGSIDEDSPWTRSLRHFYDPVNNRGLTEAISLESSKNWANDTVGQASLISSISLFGKIQDTFSGGVW